MGMQPNEIKFEWKALSAARPEANHSSISSSLLISFHSHSMKTKKRFHSKDVLKLADIITVLDCTNRYCNDLG